MTANASPKAAGTEERHSLTKILGIWVAAAVPMPILWVVQQCHSLDPAAGNASR